MRRIVVLLVVSLVGAVFAGRLIDTSAVAVNGSKLSDSTMRAELAVLQSHPSYDCYIGALAAITTTGDAHAFSAKGAATWARIQVEGLNVVNYVQNHYHWTISTAVLDKSRAIYATDLANAASAKGVTCATRASSALHQLPGWFVTDQLTQNAASEYFISKLKSAIPLTSAGLEGFYTAHQSNYDKVCVAIAIVPSAKGAAFAKAQSAGDSVATLARHFSIDATAAHGGADGCYGPASSSYSIVRDYVIGNPTGKFPTTPRQEATSSGTYLIYVAATSRTTTPYASAANLVFSDVQAYNAEIASLAQNQLLATAAVVVDPSLGHWDRASATVLTLRRPPTSSVPGAGVGLRP